MCINVPILSKWCEWVVHTNVPILSKWCEWVVHTNVPILSKWCEWVVHTVLFVNDILHCRCFIRLWNNLSFASNWVKFRLFMGPCYLFFFDFLCWVLFCPRPVSYFIEFTLFGNERKIFHIKFLFMYITLLYRADILSWYNLFPI